MPLVAAENVTQLFGAQEVLKGVSFQINESDRIGLVGPNGEGKTTLLRIIGGYLEPTLGDIRRRRGTRIGYLPQDPAPLEGTTIHQAMLDSFSDVRQMEDELHDLAARMGQGENPGLLKRYGELQTSFEALGGYNYHMRIEQVLTGLAFERDAWDRPLATLSGGQRTKAFLATLLAREPELLLLDEPTNHLDLDSVEWLEGWLGSVRAAIVVVSHDRYFLDHVTRITWEVSFGGLEDYKGAYTEYTRQRAERHKERMRVWEAQQQYITETEEFIRRYIAGQRSKEAKGRRTRLERFMRDEAVERPIDHGTIKLTLKAGRRAGDIVLRAEGLSAGYDPLKPLVEVEALDVERGWRVAVVGANGVGKTTLIRTLLGELRPLDGLVRLGAGVIVGYLSQTHAELDPEMTALDSLLTVGKGLTAERARTLLGSLLLSGDAVYKKVGDLSGGERSRVVLARLVVQGANVLFLDEPTNHLDIPSTEVIQDMLKRFDGTVIFVTHDRYLIEAVATHIWAVEDGSVRVILGGWEDYLKWRGDTTARGRNVGIARGSLDIKRREAKEARKAERAVARRRANELQRLRRRHAQLEKEIEDAERDLARLNDAISTVGEAGDVDRVYELGRKHREKDDQLQRLYASWQEVSQQLDGLGRASHGEK